MPASAHPTVFAARAWIGRGATGQVWRGVHTPSGRTVALKWLHGAQPWADLRREARLMARLDHPALLPVFDLVRLTEPGADAPRPCLVMADAPGGSLARWRGRLTVERVRQIGAGLLAGLAHLGARGLVHQDIKPDNVLLLGSPDAWRPVLADFGVGREATHGHRVGTPWFAAPEIAAGGQVGPWTDLFALARCLEALLARPPTGPFARWLARLTQHDPQDRPASAAHARSLLGAVPDVPLVLPPSAPAEAVDGTTAVVDVPVREGPVSAVEPLALAPLAVPASWGRPSAPRPPLLWRGIALWRLRRPPMMGRLAEREALWAALRCADGGDPTLCVLTGPPGCGASRLADWIAETAHARAGWGATRDGTETLDRVVWIIDPADDPAVLGRARAALAGATRLLIVAVTRASRAAAVARALGRPDGDPLTLGPLADSAMVHLIRQRLNVASALAEKLAARVGGAPGVALQALDGLLPDLVDTPAGLDLPASVDVLPTDPGNRWQARIEGLWADAAPTAQAGLVALAAIAPASRTRWVAIAGAAGWPVSEQLLQRFADADLIDHGATLRFTSEAVAQAIEHARPAAARVAHAQALAILDGDGADACLARMRHALAAEAWSAVEAAAALLAEAVIDIGHLIRLEPLVAAARRRMPDAEVLTVLEARIALVLGDRPGAQACFERIQLDRLPTDAARLVVVETRSMLHLANGELAAARALIEPLRALASAPALQLRARLAHARIETVGRAYGTVIDLLAETPLDDVAPVLAVRAEMYLQEALAESGALDAAVARLPRLFASVEAAEVPGLRPHAHNYAGTTWLRRGAVDKARVHFETALRTGPDRMPVAAYFHLNLALVDLAAGDADAAAARLDALSPRFTPWPVRISQLMCALRLQAAAMRAEQTVWPALIERLEAQLEDSATNDTRLALEAAAERLPPAPAARVRGVLARLAR